MKNDINTNNRIGSKKGEDTIYNLDLNYRKLKENAKITDRKRNSNRMPDEVFEHRVEAIGTDYKTGKMNTKLIETIGYNLSKDERIAMQQSAVRTYLGAQEPGDERYRRWLINNSLLCMAVASNPGNNELTEFFYTYTRNGKEPELKMDIALCQTEIGKAVGQRLEAVKTELPKYIKEGQLVANIASGKGTDVLEMAKSGNLNGSSIINLDNDGSDLKEGVDTTSSLLLNGVGFEYFDFFNDGHIKNNKDRFDGGSMIGVLCPMAPHFAIRFIRERINPLIKQGGFLVASSSTAKMQYEEPFVYHGKMEQLGWFLSGKTPKQMEQIFNKSGFTLKEFFYDEPNRYHAMAVGIKK